MSNSRTRVASVGRESPQLSQGLIPNDLYDSSDLHLDEYGPSHPKFDRSKLTDEQFIEQLLFENREFQAVIKKQDTWIDALTSQLKAHEIIPAVQRTLKTGSSFLPRRRPSKADSKTPSSRTKPKALDLSKSPSQLPISTSQIALALPITTQTPLVATPTDKFKRNPSNSVLDPKGGVHLSPRLASAAAAAAAIADSTGTGTGSDLDITSSYFNNSGKSETPSLAEDDIPERSSRRRRESVRIDHPTTRFQEKEERERLEKEELEREILAKEEEERNEREALEKEALVKAEKERQEKEEAERLEKIRLEKIRVENERVEQERLQKEKEEQERLEKERIEQEKLEQQRLEQERIERLEREKVEMERLEKERIERELQEKRNQEALEKMRIENERLEAERFEREKIEREQFEQEELAREARELQEKLEQNVYPSDGYSNKASLEDFAIASNGINNKPTQKSLDEAFKRSSIYSEEELETMISNTSDNSDIKANVNRNNSILSQEKNQSNSSFNSYKSRLRLPATLSQQSQPAPPQQQPPQLQRQVSQGKTQAPMVLRQVSQSKPQSTSFLQQLQQQIQHSQQQQQQQQQHLQLHQIQQLQVHNLQPLLHSQDSQVSLPQYQGLPILPPQYQLQTSLHSPQSYQDRNYDALKPAPVLRTDQLPSPSFQDQNQNQGHRVTTPVTQFGGFDPSKKIPYTPEGMQSFGIKVNDMNVSQDDMDAKSYISSPQQSAYPQSNLSPSKSEFGGSTNDTILKTPSNQQFYALDSLSAQSQSYQQNSASAKQQGRVSDNGESSSVSSFQVLKTPKQEDSNLFIRPEEFQTISIYVLSTIYLNPSRKSDDPLVTLSVSDKDTGKEMWRIRKSYSQLLAFDNEIRPIIEYFGLPLVPDKSLFFSTSPVKIDARRNQLQNYFNTLFLMPHIPQSVLYRICRYLSLDFVSPLDDFKSGAKKEGYLIRRYKGIGTSWKVRWCQVDGPTLEIYEAPGGTLLEQIRLRGSQIGRQSADSVAEEKGYRHAFLLMEGQKSSKLSNSLPKHFFCAESDEERDEWIDCLVEYNGSANDLFASRNSSEADVDSTVVISPQKLNNHLQQLFHQQNQLNVPGGHGNGGYIENQSVASRHPPHSTSSLSSPVSMYHNGGANGSSSNILDQDPNRSMTTEDTTVSSKDFKENAAAAAAAAKKLKKRSIFPFRTKNASHENHQAGNEMESSNSLPQYSQPYTNGGQVGGSEPSMQHYLDQMNLDVDVSKSIFGRDVAEAFKLSNQNFFGRQVPSVCYRCLDYLSRTGAVFEEGIFRLSGSASSIRQLRDMFNTKFDVDLFDCPIQPDIHTVAGLFKTYLRELPAPILGVGPFNDLKAIANNKDKYTNPAMLALQFRDYISDSNKLDPIHFDVCFAIFKFLTQIIANSSSNRMNLRNVCIVFVPTLNISLEVLSIILIDFDCIFEGGQPVPDDRREVLDLYIPNF